MGKIIFLLVSAFFCGFGGFSIYEHRRFFKRAIMVSGVVTDYAVRRDKDGDIMYAPVVQFDFNGEPRHVTGLVYSYT